MVVNVLKSISARALCWTPLGELTTFPQTPSWWGGAQCPFSKIPLPAPETPPKMNPTYGLERGSVKDTARIRERESEAKIIVTMLITACCFNSQQVVKVI